MPARLEKIAAKGRKLATPYYKSCTRIEQYIYCLYYTSDFKYPICSQIIEYLEKNPIFYHLPSF